jgi:CDP-diacylglycerol--glycerol-3-phosphate 3-phosphatidyltransferase
MTTPNKITIARICLIPVFVMMALYYGRSVAHGAPQEWMRWSALAIFVLAAASDGVDGYIARRYNQMSRLGVILDPIADKGLLLAGIVTLSISNWQYEFPVWFPVLIISRDIIIVGGAVVLHFLNGSVKVRPSWAGKTATVAQMVAIGAVMLLTSHPWKTEIAGFHIALLDIPVFVAGIFTLVSGIGYVARSIPEFHKHGHGDPKPPEEL